jgi:4-hydroxy-3-polyprenylbenzoate decarboxylase
MSLAKYLMIADGNEAPELDLYDIERFFGWVLERVDFSSDLHFQTKTTIDTLDYSGEGFNQGSKLVIAASGPRKRVLATECPSQISLPEGFHSPKLCMRGVLAIQANARASIDTLLEHWTGQNGSPLDHSSSGKTRAGWMDSIPWVVLVDDSAFTSQSVNNFLWVAFTRSNPATDIRGVDETVQNKHWGCVGPIVLDARIKPHHAPPLLESPEATRRIDALAARGGAIAKYL